MNSRYVSLLLGFVAILSGCARDIPYSGDGHLVDHGLTAPDHRYVAEIGTLDLSRPGTKTFRFAGLPKAHYVIGLQLPLAADKGADPDSGTVADVALQLMRVGEGQVLIITGPLRGLDWVGDSDGMSAFAFRRKDYEAYFDAEPKEHYELRVVVNHPDPALPPGTEVVVKSGGWK